MSTAERVVSALIENDLSPEEFMQSFGMRRLLGFHFAPARRYHGDYWNVPGAVLVYANRPDDTRDFVGVIREIKDVGWISLAVNRVPPFGAPSYRVAMHAGKPWPTKEDAANEVLTAFEKPDGNVGESALSPKEFVKSMPHLLSRYEFIPTAGRAVDVKRWENGSYYYLGSVAEIYSGKWAPYSLAPVGRLHHASVLGVQAEDLRPTREEAARDLWGIYKAEMDSAERK
jgi:hypothetical protein